MKKLVTMMLAIVLTVAFAVTAFADQSIVITGVVQKAASATDASGNPLEVTISSAESSLDAELVKKLVADLSKTDTLKELLGSDYVDGMKVLDLVDVTVPEGTAFPATITFNVPGVTASSNVGILHYTGTEWEKIDAKAGDQSITGIFQSLSPVAFVVDGNTATTASGSTTSPKTGESQTAMWVSIIALAALAGMAVTFRGRAKNAAK